MCTITQTNSNACITSVTEAINEQMSVKHGTVRVTSKADSLCTTESGSSLAWDAGETLDAREVVDSHIVKTHRLLHTALGTSTAVT